MVIDLKIQDFMDSNRMWMPMMLFSGIMNIMFFTSICHDGNGNESNGKPDDRNRFRKHN
jgi:hypothetical protein